MPSQDLLIEIGTEELPPNALSNLSRSFEELLCESLKKLEKGHDLSEDNLRRALDNIQETTDEYIKKINTIQDLKEKEILN